MSQQDDMRERVRAECARFLDRLPAVPAVVVLRSTGMATVYSQLVADIGNHPPPTRDQLGLMLGRSGENVGRHLRQLKRYGLVRCRQQGRDVVWIPHVPEPGTVCSPCAAKSKGKHNG